MPTKPIDKLCPGCDQPMLPKGVKKRPNEYDHAQGCPYGPKVKRKPVPSDTERLDKLEALGIDGAVPVMGLECWGDETTCWWHIAVANKSISGHPQSSLRAAIDAAPDSPAMRAARRKR